MKGLRFVSGDEALRTEDGLRIRKNVIMTVRRQFKGRMLFKSLPPALGVGVSVFGYDTLSEVSDASLDYAWPGPENKDIINLARSTVAIPNLHKEAEINKIDLRASMDGGQPLNITNILSQAYKVAMLENAIIIDGYSRDGTTYEIQGLYQAAGNDYAVASNWGVPANIITSINGAIALMLASNYQHPFNLTLNSTQWVELQPLIGSTSKSYFEWVIKALNGPNNEGGGRGKIRIDASIVAGTALMSVVDNEGQFDYIRAEDYTTYLKILEKTENLFARVYVRGLPIVYNAVSLCKLSNI